MDSVISNSVRWGHHNQQERQLGTPSLLLGGCQASAAGVQRPPYGLGTLFSLPILPRQRQTYFTLYPPDEVLLMYNDTINSFRQRSEGVGAGASREVACAVHNNIQGWVAASVKPLTHERQLLHPRTLSQLQNKKKSVQSIVHGGRSMIYGEVFHVVYMEISSEMRGESDV